MPLPKPTIAETRKDFMTRCNNKSDLEVIFFMEEKYVQYIENRNQNKD